MPVNTVERRLVALLSLDVVEYARLMAEDEEAALEALEQVRAVVRAAVSGHGGRLFGVAGDSLMAEFASTLAAVECAVQVQTRVGSDGGVPIRLRAGCHLADVISSGEDLFGDGVNIAARLQQLADAGGICVSDDVYRNVRTRVLNEFVDLGPRTFKNLVEPVHAWQIALESPDFPATGAGPAPVESRLGIGGSAIQGLGRPPVARADKVSIVILPFENLTADAADEHYCDGLTREIASELARFRNLTVISPHSAFTYKGRRVTPQRVAHDLDVRYLTEGSFRRWHARFRLDIQLIDAGTGVELWAERFNRELSDLITFEEELVEGIVSTLSVRMEKEERARVRSRSTTDLSAYELYLRGVDAYSDESRDALERSMHLFEAATAKDPTFARGWGYLAYTHTQRAISRWCESPEEKRQALADAERFAKMAVHLDPDDYANHWDMAFVCTSMERHEQALECYRRAVALNPNDADLLAELAQVLMYSGDVAGGVKSVERAMRLNPFYPPWYRWVAGFGYYFLGEYDLTVEAIKPVGELHPDVCLPLAAAYAQQGRADLAKRQIALFRTDRPGWTVSDELRRMPFNRADQAAHWAEGLRKAGLPDGD